MTQQHPVPVWMKSIAVFAIIFALITIFKSASILFGSQSAQDAAGDFVPFVLQFNFVAGFFYLVAGIGIFLGRGWAFGLSVLIALATIITSAFFARHAMANGAFMMQTVGALAIRAGFWSIVALLLWRKARAR